MEEIVKKKWNPKIVSPFLHNRLGTMKKTRFILMAVAAKMFPLHCCLGPSTSCLARPCEINYSRSLRNLEVIYRSCPVSQYSDTKP
jgi:hypothetical protein